MGCFAATCAVSGLPIEGGDDVRILLLTENPFGGRATGLCDIWFPRTYPLTAQYNDYGSAEHVQEGPARDIWLEGLKLDLVPRGRGDNPIHDVPVDTSMTWDQLLEAVWEQRLFVRREWHGDVLMDELRRLSKANAAKFEDDPAVGPIVADVHAMLGQLESDRRPTPKLPKGVPTRVRVERALTAARLVLYKPEVQHDDHTIAAFMVDKRSPGCVRVRFHALCKETFGKDVEYLTIAQQALDPIYATAVVAGTGNYARTAELLVFARPGTKWSYRQRDSKKPLGIAMAMIREDVWQALLHVKLPGERGRGFTIDRYYESIADYAKEYDQQIKSGEPLGDKLLDWLHRTPLADFVGRDAVPFTVGLASHWQLMRRKGPPPPDFLTSAAELAYIHSILSLTRYYWRPGYTAGPQTGEWPLHQRTLAALADVAQAGVKRFVDA